MSDLEFSEEDCPKCQSQISGRQCYSCGGSGCFEDDDDEWGFDTRCDNCDGSGFEEWCRECGWDMTFSCFLSKEYAEAYEKSQAANRTKTRCRIWRRLRTLKKGWRKVNGRFGVFNVKNSIGRPSAKLRNRLVCAVVKTRCAEIKTKGGRDMKQTTLIRIELIIAFFFIMHFLLFIYVNLDKRLENIESNLCVQKAVSN